jgi:hypothetical protein
MNFAPNYPVRCKIIGVGEFFDSRFWKSPPEFAPLPGATNFSKASPTPPKRLVNPGTGSDNDRRQGIGSSGAVRACAKIGGKG